MKLNNSEYTDYLFFPQNKLYYVRFMLYSTFMKLSRIQGAWLTGYCEIHMNSD